MSKYQSQKSHAQRKNRQGYKKNIYTLIISLVREIYLKGTDKKSLIFERRVQRKIYGLIKKRK